MYKDNRDASLDDELARIRASFLKAAAVASAAAAPVTAAAVGRSDAFARPAAAPHPPAVAVPHNRPQTASARPQPGYAEGSKNSELYQVYVGSLKRTKARKKNASGGSALTPHLAVRVPLIASKGSADADDGFIDEDTGHEEDDMVDDSIDMFLSAKSSSASSSRPRRVTSAPMSRSSLNLDSSLKLSAPNNSNIADAAKSAREAVLAVDPGIRAEAAKSVPNDNERRTWSELPWDDRLLLVKQFDNSASAGQQPGSTAIAGQRQMVKPCNDAPGTRVLKSRPASASHAQRSSFDWSSRSKLAVSQLQRSQTDAAATSATRKSESCVVPSANPYLPTDSDASASRPKPSAHSFLARVAAAAERSGGLNDALQLSMMRKRGEGRNVYVTDGSCPDLKGCMEARGWHLNPSPSSPLFDLRWTLQEADSDIHTLQPGQINNHFPQNHVLTTKVGLLKSLRGLRWSADCDEDTFFPRAYDLSDPAQKDDWIDDFKFCATASIIELVSRMHICAIHCGNLLHHSCVAGRSVVRMAVGEAYRHISTRSDANFLNPVPLSITELDDEAWASMHNLRRSLLTSHWSASEPGSFIRIDAESQDSSRPMDECRECRKMMGANSTLNSCSAEAADHMDLVSRCCQVYDSLKEFCPQRSLLGPAACWIVKPNCSSRGVGVRLTDDMVELAAGKSEGRVVQKYIERPLLVNGKKFDLRVWVLVTSWAPLIIWVFPECLARFCSHPFSLNDLGNKHRHLTNVSLNKSVTGAGDITWSAEGIKEAIDVQFRAGFWEEEVWPKVVRTCSLAFISAQGVIEQQDNCFELFGCDVALDAQGHPWLLEVNTSPDLRHSTPSKKAITPTLVEDTMKLVIDIGLPTITQELSRSYGLRKPSPQLQDIGRVFLDPPTNWHVGMWRLAYVGLSPPASSICSQATLLSVNGAKISSKMALRMAAVAGAAEHAAAGIFSACVFKRGIRRSAYRERHENTVQLQSVLRRSLVWNAMQQLRFQSNVLSSVVRRLNAHPAAARLFASLKLGCYVKAAAERRKVSFSYAQELLARFVRMKIERNWIVRWFENESVVRRVFLGMVSRYFIKKAKELLGSGIPDGISTICRLVVGVNVNQGSHNIVALIDTFKARDLAMRTARVLQAHVLRTLERARYIDELCARRIVAVCRRYHARRRYALQLISSFIAALVKQACTRYAYQNTLSSGKNLIVFAKRKLLSCRYSSAVRAAMQLSSACRRALVAAVFNKYKRAGTFIAPWAAAAAVRQKWMVVRASMVIARRLLTSITCWRWKGIYSVAVLKSRLLSWVLRKRFVALRKCARSLQVMCLWLLARRRACITLQHSVRCHRARCRMSEQVQQRAKLIAKFVRRRRLELVSPGFKVVSLHTAKEVSDLYVHSKSAAEMENERRPWRRLKRTALRDAEALAESVIGIPADDLRRRFRGVIGRRVLVTLSSMSAAAADDSASDLHVADVPARQAHAADKEAFSYSHRSAVETQPHSSRSVPVHMENCPPPPQAQPDDLSAAQVHEKQSSVAVADEKQSSVARYLHLKNHSAGSFLSEQHGQSHGDAFHLQRPSTGHTSGSSVRYLYAGEEAGVAGQSAHGRHVGVVTRSVPGATLPQALIAQQNMPRVIQLPKQILLHLEATAKTRASISAAISIEPIEQQGATDLNALRKIYSQSMSGSSNMRAFSASK